jgi:predicted alpha/beta-fold hydrolase
MEDKTAKMDSTIPINLTTAMRQLLHTALPLRIKPLAMLSIATTATTAIVATDKRVASNCNNQLVLTSHNGEVIQCMMRQQDHHREKVIMW